MRWLWPADPKANSGAIRQESHIISYYHLLLTSGLPFLKDVRIEELDYASSLTIGKPPRENDKEVCLFHPLELYERHTGGSETKNYSIRLAVSEGAHASSVLDSAVDAVSDSRRGTD